MVISLLINNKCFTKYAAARIPWPLATEMNLTSEDLCARGHVKRLQDRVDMQQRNEMANKRRWQERTPN